MHEGKHVKGLVLRLGCIWVGLGGPSLISYHGESRDSAFWVGDVCAITKAGRDKVEEKMLEALIPIVLITRKRNAFTRNIYSSVLHSMGKGARGILKPLGDRSSVFH